MTNAAIIKGKTTKIEEELIKQARTRTKKVKMKKND